MTGEGVNASGETKRREHRTDESQPILSVVVPLFDEEQNLSAFLGVLIPVLENLSLPFEVVLVDDGSCDGTWAGIVDADRRDPRITGICFSRNFGHQNALMAGLEAASGSAIVSLDGDLQHPPELIPRLVEEWQAGYKVVNTVRIDAEETTFFKRISSRWFYRVFSFLSGLPVAPGASDFRLVDRAVVDVITRMHDAQPFLRGFVQWADFPSTSLAYQAQPRHAGSTKYNLVKMLRFSVGAVVSFSSLPLKIGVWIGVATSFLAGLEIIYILVEHFRGHTVPGWASVLTVVSFMFGVLFFLLGIIGTYLSDIHETLKGRPRYIIRETVGQALPRGERTGGTRALIPRRETADRPRYIAV
jgi:dolichol-phosphate mannosyltransferase